MFKTLSARLAAVLLALLCLIGTLYIGLTLFSTQMYMQEVDQKLNHNLAQNLVAKKLLMEDGQVDRPQLEALFQTLMVINPSIEIYLLDPQGLILACSAPREQLHRKTVDLQPLRRFLSGEDEMPIFGDDPKNRRGYKVFSAAPIPVNLVGAEMEPLSHSDELHPAPVGMIKGPIAGYLYVVLGGQAYDSTAQMLQGSYILTLSFMVVLASLLLALAAGLLLFRFLTRRLSRLSLAMEEFKQRDFATPVSALTRSAFDGRSGDEITRLGVTFHEMAGRIGEQLRSLKETDTLRRELVANVSHDLRTPLASLQGYIETLLLKEGKLTEDEQRSYLEIALRHSERLSNLVAELFELAKLDAQVTPLVLERFAVGELVQDVVQDFQLTAHKKGVDLQMEFHGEPPFVYADIGLIERVLDNLLENALAYTPAGGKITVAINAEQENVKIEIRDTGCGIPEADLPYIFDRFYRVEKSRQDAAKGAGLGLAIAKRIMELHDASIQVNSTLESGTAFSFSLLLAKPAALPGRT